MTRYRYARRAEVLGASVHDHEPGAVVLSSGLAYPPLLPDVVREAMEAARDRPRETLQYGPLMGLDDLRDEVARFAGEEGVDCTRENVLITYGAKSALDLACRVFAEAGDRVIVTRPTYMTALQIMRLHGVAFLDVGQDEEGLDTEELEAKLDRLRANGEAMPKLLFDVPDFHNPTGITTSAARRRRLVELAQRHGFVILEDDPYRRIRFEGEAVPPIKAFDESGVVVGLGTVSKILAPGLRVGWAIGARAVVERMAMQKADGGTNPFSQRVVTDLMRGNKMARHMSDLAEQMRRHRDVMVESFAAFLPEARVRVPAGGYFLWAELPEGSDAEAIATLALARGVEVSSGRLCFPNEVPGHHLRLAYSFVDCDAIRNGVRALGEACDEYRARVRARGPNAPTEPEVTSCPAPKCP